MRKAVCIQKISGRLRQRSAKAPPQGPKRNVGKICAAVMNAGHLDSPEISNASQLKAVVCIQVPTSEITCPATKRR